MGVSTAYLCQALLDVRGIIRPGLMVKYGLAEYKTTNQTTIGVIAN